MEFAQDAKNSNVRNTERVDGSIANPVHDNMIFSYAVTTLWHERQRFLSGVLAVAFSAVLINLQTGILWGLFATTSSPIDHTSADVWVGAPEVNSVDLGRAITENHLARLAKDPAVEAPEMLLLDYGFWIKSNGGKELCIVIGSRLTPDSLGAVRELSPELRARLTEPGSIVVDASELTHLGLKGIGDFAELSGCRVRVVGLVHGLSSLTGAYVFCSIDTARQMMRLLPGQATYILARCRRPELAASVVERMRPYHDLSAFTREEFSLRTRLHWLIMTNAGLATGFTTVLGLLVGAVVTSQTLYTATIASLREFAVLRALGIPRWRIGLAVVVQSAGVGILGVLVALPVTFGLAFIGEIVGTHILLPGWLLVTSSILTLGMALLSGTIALRSLRLMEPATLLR